MILGWEPQRELSLLCLLLVFLVLLASVSLLGGTQRAESRDGPGRFKPFILLFSEVYGTLVGDIMMGTNYKLVARVWGEIFPLRLCLGPQSM